MAFSTRSRSQPKQHTLKLYYHSDGQHKVPLTYWIHSDEDTEPIGKERLPGTNQQNTISWH